MSDRKQTRQRSGKTKRESRTLGYGAARELELHAIEEQILSEHRAGLHPRLSTYLRRYPEYGAELAAFVALAFSPDSQSGALLLTNDGDAHHGELQTSLSSGTRRALDEIFGVDVGEAAIVQLRVAERRAGYDSKSVPMRSPEDPGE